MGWFSCFDSKEEERFNQEDDRKDIAPLPPAIAANNNFSKLSSGGDKLKLRNNMGAKREAPAVKDEPEFNLAAHAHTFAFRELATATNNFREESCLGEGGFGRVYKGMLENGQVVVAVKQLDRNGLQGNREFLVEVLMLSLLHHPNLVNLIGYCADGEQRLLVYEFMPLGSLEDHLLDLPPDKEPLDWSTRMKIASGAARGLEYLHDKANPPARPLFNDRKKFVKLADPLMQGKFPMRGLYQALAVASMCIQENAAARPHMGDVVTALSYLANQNEGGGRIGRNEEGAAGGSGRKWDLQAGGSDKDDSPRETGKTSTRDSDRERAVAEAKLWGENLREKRRQSAQGTTDRGDGVLA
ncbi:hypothetical protein V2J09_004141 [Rumex salicifolius]